MPAFMDTRCEKCGARIGWMGELTDRPKCSKCAYRPSNEKLQEDQKYLDEMEQTLIDKANKRKEQARAASNPLHKRLPKPIRKAKDAVVPQKGNLGARQGSGKITEEMAKEAVRRVFGSDDSEDQDPLPDRSVNEPKQQKVDWVLSQGQTREHDCHGGMPGCKGQCPPARWGCYPCWKKLPKYLRDKIWAAYKPGQEVNLSPSSEYLKVAREVQEWIEANYPNRRQHK